MLWIAAALGLTLGVKTYYRWWALRLYRAMPRPPRVIIGTLTCMNNQGPGVVIQTLRDDAAVLGAHAGRNN